MAETSHYVTIDVHKTDSQVAVLDDRGEVVEECRIENDNLDEIAQKYEGSQASLGGPKQLFHHLRFAKRVSRGDPGKSGQGSLFGRPILENRSSRCQATRSLSPIGLGTRELRPAHVDQPVPLLGAGSKETHQQTDPLQKRGPLHP